MQGISGIIELDPRRDPVARQSELAARMRRTWPGSEVSTVAAGPAALGRADLAGPAVGRRDPAPWTLGDDCWVVADARLDGREALRSKLRRSSLGPFPADVANETLILAAYLEHGAAFVDGLLGDFAIVIWDRPRGRVLAARDPFGVRALYWSQDPRTETLVFASVPTLVRSLVPGQGDWNELAVADYLLFGTNQDPATTLLGEVSRLPPATVRTWEAGASRARRYWHLPVEDVDEDDLAAPPHRLLEALREAVRDRTSDGPVSSLLSGGLDSTSVMATAAQLGVEPVTHHFGYRTLIEDREPMWARRAAAGIGLAMKTHWLDDFLAFDGTVLGDGSGRAGAEPSDVAFEGMFRELDRRVGEGPRTVLTGQGGDPVLVPQGRYFLDALRERKLGKAFRYVAGSLVRDRRLPPLGLLGAWQRSRHLRNLFADFPEWLAPDFVRDLDLRSRWTWYWLERAAEVHHPTHPRTAAVLADIEWPSFFERHAATVRETPLELRHPLFDLRVVREVLRSPPVPWCLDKRLLREAMAGILPESVRRRHKTPLLGNPIHRLGTQLQAVRSSFTECSSGLDRFVDLDRYHPLFAVPSVMGGRMDEPTRRPIGLAVWIGRTQRVA